MPRLILLAAATALVCASPVVVSAQRAPVTPAMNPSKTPNQAKRAYSTKSSRAGQHRDMRATASTAKAPLKRRLTFTDGDDVTAGRATGGGDLISVRRGLVHSSLIPVREDFLPELIKAGEDI